MHNYYTFGIVKEYSLCYIHRTSLYNITIDAHKYWYNGTRRSIGIIIFIGISMDA